ncbi:4-coumarate--CoA ligase 1-like [Penaeus japonicus]|uniref:4-coumarate--CoA ligase 1-like n=1 Tax=Penaeus japonicus TaxID=27405 RepID=UPI001C70E721|nr:4-coumarate--CoA ligase 1-like [Penaeus japonicus]XP_042883756.1 4-coumarate--CoA ligase 1-like [Penaeus japonicus]
MGQSSETVAGRGKPRVAKHEGPRPLPPIPNTNYASFMLERMQAHGDNVAMVDEEARGRRTYAELCDLIPRASGGLKAAGVSPGDVVLLITKNHIDYPLAMLAIIHRGATCAPVSPTLKPDELVHVVKISKARYVIACASAVGAVKEAYFRMPKWTLKQLWVLDSSSGISQFGRLLQQDPVPAFSTDDGLDPAKSVALLPFSSGTTGLPKGVMLSHRTLLVPHVRSVYQESIRPKTPKPTRNLFQTVMLFLPVSHTYGHGMVTATLFNGGTVVVMLRFSPKSFFETIERFKVTWAPIVPYIANFLIDTPLMKKFDISSLVGFTTAAAPISAAASNTLMKKTGRVIGSAYGLTETNGAVSANSTLFGFNPESVGRIVPYCDVKVVDVETGRMLGERQEGEVCARGPNIMLGYMNNPKATASALDAEGWLHTGDIGYFDEDNFLFITDRIKDLIKVKSLQVSPTELEALLLSHPAVEDAAVVGVPHAKLGEAPRAYVVLRSGAILRPHEIEDFVSERVSSYKQLAGGVRTVDAIPRNPAGKILRRQLKKDFMSSKL